MSPSMHSFYLARAADCRRDAKAATLVNARDRLLTSEATWRQLAARAARTEARHARLVAEKSAGRTVVAAS